MISKINVKYFDNYTKPLRFGSELYFKLAIKKERTPETAKWMRRQMTELGPTYTKIGQIVSTRIDLFPEYITDELSLLQDKMNSFPISDVINTIESEFNTNVDELFSFISEKPLAAASIGQVHIARLKENNKQVVIKIQRPGIGESISKDLSPVLEILNKLKFLQIRSINDIALTIRECSVSINQELDFLNEYKNMKIFQNIYSVEDGFVIPKVYKKLSSKKILTMQYVPGIKISNIAGLKSNKIDCKKLANKIMSSFINVLVKYGYIHADPHPGNVSILKNGKIVLYDYGLVSRIEINFKSYFKKLLNGFLNKDYKLIMNILLEGNIIYALESNAKTISDLTDLEYVILSRMVNYILNYTVHLDVKILNKEIENDDLIEANNIPFVFDSTMILVFKTFSTLEGICKSLDNTFTYDKIFQQLVEEELEIDFTMLLSRARKDITDVFNSDSENMDEKILSIKLKRIDDNMLDKQTIMMMFIIYLIFT